MQKTALSKPILEVLQNLKKQQPDYYKPEIFFSPKIDSLRIHLPINKVKVGDSGFLENNIQNISLTDEQLQKLIDEDGDTFALEFSKEVLGDTHVKCNEHTRYNGVSVKYQKVCFVKGKDSLDGVKKEFITIGFSSKLTQSNEYLTGVNLYNIESIYNYIIKDGVVSFSLEDFLLSAVVDTDICNDILLSGTTCKTTVLLANQLAKNFKGTNVNAFLENNNQGIEFGDRNKVGKAYKTKQYLKYYNKYLELKHKSNDFKRAYLKLPKEVNEDNWLRVETTIKNSKHFETYGIKAKTLIDLLLLDLSVFPELFNRPIHHYMDGDVTIVVQDKLSLKDRALLQMFQKYHLPNFDCPFQALESLAVSIMDFNDSKQKKSDFKSAFKRVQMPYILQEMQSKKKVDSKESQLNLLRDLKVLP